MLIGRILILALLSLPILLQPAFAQARWTGQPLSNLRKKTVYAHQTFVQLDSLSIISKTLSIPGVPDSLYTIDYVKAALTWKANTCTRYPRCLLPGLSAPARCRAEQDALRQHHEQFYRAALCAQLCRRISIGRLLQFRQHQLQW